MNSFTTIMYKAGHSNVKVKMQETGADLDAELDALPPGFLH